MKRIVILGSTGSIGTQVLDVVRRMPGKFDILGLSANSNSMLLVEQAKEFQVPFVSTGSDTLIPEIASQLTSTTQVFSGVEGMSTLATLPECDLVVVAVAGSIGIIPTHAALAAGKDIGLASKEVLVAAGEVTMKLAKEKGCTLYPIDSEHSAIFQCLQGSPEGSIERILLTASGGPFRTWEKSALANVTPQQALRHPTWNMGGLVTINSATLMNKALEVIEARWLFGVSADNVEVVVHPQSIVHSMVRFTDGSTIAQLGLPDMRLPIQYALVYPERIDTKLPRMEISDYTNLTFESPDEQKFTALKTARQALAAGGVAPAVMNGANEVAVGMFLEGRIPFLRMAELIDMALQNHERMSPALENVLFADSWSREYVKRIVD